MTPSSHPESLPADFDRAANMEELYAALKPTGMGPGWNKPTPSLWPAPRQNFLPAHWRYAVSKPALDAAGRYVSTELAERRNLILVNPVPGNDYGTARTLVAAYQMVKPHETARSHRHSPNALRLVVDADPETYTIVDGKKIPMLPGDVLLTPNWCWHGHSNESDACAYWIDFLDVPLVHLLEPMFMEFHQEWVETASEVQPDSPFRFAFSDVSAKLDKAQPISEGRRVVDLGPPQMDTIGLSMTRLDAGARHDAGKTTANSIYAVIDGEGVSDVDGTRIEWARGDVFVVPGWRPAVHSAKARSHLLRVTDEPVMKKLGWLRD